MFKAFAVSDTSKLLPVRRFLASDWFGWILMVLALVALFTNQYVYVLVGAIFVGALVLLLTDDPVSMFMPVLITAAVIIQAKNSFDAIMRFLPVYIFFVVAVVLHFFLYKAPKGTHMGKLKVPMLLICFTVFLGGLGSIAPAEYFAGVSIGHMFALGPMLLIFYWELGRKIRPGQNYTDQMDVRLSKMCCMLTLFLFLAVLEYYLEHFDVFSANPGILPFQWRNNASTMLMMAMPFTFYMGSKHFKYYFFSLISALTLVLTGSRAGLLMGGIEFVALLIYFGIADKRHRKLLLGVVAAGVLVLLVFLPKLLPFLSYTLGRFTMESGENTIRLEHWKRSVQDFLTNPVFGMGLGYMGNSDIHHNAEGVLCYYHSSIPQIIGSFGLLGVATYGYQFIARVKLMTSRTSLFARSVLWSFIGLELMSLVNPGIFSPLYAFYMVVLLVITENYSFGVNNEV